MTEDPFVRSFNRKRRMAKVSLALLLGVIALPAVSRWAGYAVEDLSASVFMLAIGVYLLANWILCKCPGCGRFIGIAGELNGIPRGAPCPQESRHLERLDWPES